MTYVKAAATGTLGTTCRYCAAPTFLHQGTTPICLSCIQACDQEPTLLLKARPGQGRLVAHGAVAR
jgi:hypothetical protein